LTDVTPVLVEILRRNGRGQLIHTVGGDGGADLKLVKPAPLQRLRPTAAVAAEKVTSTAAAAAAAVSPWDSARDTPPPLPALHSSAVDNVGEQAEAS
jgi:hypothetical protein